MKKSNFSLGALALLVCLASCGKKGNDNNGNVNNQQTADEIQRRCQGNPQCVEAEMQRLYGNNSQGYYQGSQNYGGQQWHQFQAPYYQQNNCNPCQQQNFWSSQGGSYYGRRY